MSTLNTTKINQIISGLKPHVVVTHEWFKKNGVSRDLQKRYVKSGWFTALGRGAYVRLNDTVEWIGALHSIQTQINPDVHLGALSAISLQGYSHYIRKDNERIYVYYPYKTRVPKWFKEYDWKFPLELNYNTLFKTSKGKVMYNQNDIDIIISSPERAILELIELAPNKFDLIECYEILEGLANLQPKLLQILLENCTSVKTKRLFMYMSEKINHMWFEDLDTQKVDFGSGKRQVVKNGVYNHKYLITVPESIS